MTADAPAPEANAASQDFSAEERAIFDEVVKAQDDARTATAPHAEPAPTPVATPAEPAPVAAPQPIPPSPAPDLWATATDEQRAAFQAAQQAAQEAANKVTQQTRSDAGRISALTRELNALKAKTSTSSPTTSAAPADKASAPQSLRDRPKIKKVMEDYPEVAEALVEALDQQGSAVGALLEKDRAAELVRNEQQLNTAHPDWRQVVATEQFAAWFAELPPSIQKIAEKNGENIEDAGEAIALVNTFKQYLAATAKTPTPISTPQPPAAPAPAAPTNLADRRTAQLESSRAAPSKGPAPPGGGVPAVTDDEAYFNSLVAKQDAARKKRTG